MDFLSPNGTPVRNLNLTFLIPYFTQSTAWSVGKLLFSGFRTALPWHVVVIQKQTKENQKRVAFKSSRFPLRFHLVNNWGPEEQTFFIITTASKDQTRLYSVRLSHCWDPHLCQAPIAQTPFLITLRVLSIDSIVICTKCYKRNGG